MMTNDEKRELIIIELNNRAISEGTIDRYFKTLIPIITSYYVDAGSDAVKLMGLAQALLRHVMTIFYCSVTTPADLNIRTAEDVSKMAVAVWNDACLNAEKQLLELNEKGIEVPDAILERIKMMPSDPSKRPDLLPIDTLAGVQGRPRSIAELLSRLASEPEPTKVEPMVEEQEILEVSKDESSKSPAVKVPKLAVWSVGSTMGGLAGDLEKIGNGKGN